MRFRDAVPDDVERLAALARRGPVDTDVSPRSLRDMVHDRTVVVAERDGRDGPDPAGATGEDGGAGGDGSGGGDIVGYVSYDADEGAVVVHHLVAEGAGADDEVLATLLDHPTGFADREGLPVRIGLRAGEPAVHTVEDAGFDVVDRQRFADDEVVRYERPAPDER